MVGSVTSGKSEKTVVGSPGSVLALGSKVVIVVAIVLNGAFDWAPAFRTTRRIPARTASLTAELTNSCFPFPLNVIAPSSKRQPRATVYTPSRLPFAVRSGANALN